MKSVKDAVLLLVIIKVNMEAVTRAGYSGQ